MVLPDARVVVFIEAFGRFPADEYFVGLANLQAFQFVNDLQLSNEVDSGDLFGIATPS
jgi:hypothetical protein